MIVVRALWVAYFYLLIGVNAVLDFLIRQADRLATCHPIEGLDAYTRTYCWHRHSFGRWEWIVSHGTLSTGERFWEVP